MSSRCENCGEMTLEERHGDYVFRWPESVSCKPSTFRNAEWLECTTCRIRILSEDLSDRIEAKRYALQELLTPAELREIRRALGLSQIEMARRLHVGDKSYCRWENGHSIQSKAIDTLIRGTLLYPDMLASVETSRTCKEPTLAPHRSARSKTARGRIAERRKRLVRSEESSARHQRRRTVARALVLERKAKRLKVTKRVSSDYPSRSTVDEPTAA